MAECRDQSCDLTRGECCRVEAVLSVDARGQLVLPKEVRESASIMPGDKLALVSMFENGQTSCLVLFKASTLAKKTREMLGPLMKDLYKETP